MIVYKYKLEQDPGLVQGLTIPAGAKFLSAGEQHGELYVWCLLPNAEAMTYTRKVYVLGTGIEASHIQLGDIASLRFLNTVQMSSGLVWHIFVA